MLEIPIPKEIRKYEEKYYFNLTLRQLISAILIILDVIFFNFFLSKYINEQIISYLTILTVIPLALIGFFRYNDMRIEKFFKLFLLYYIYPQKRKYTIKNEYKEILELIREEANNSD